MAIAEVGPEARTQQHANAIGASRIELESSWWGNEKFGTWSETWWARIDTETEDAVHVNEASDSRNPVTESLWSVDVWLPKSQITMIAEPEWEPTTNPSDPNGTIRVGSTFRTEYGVKRKITGDTFEAFKEDDLADELPWEKTHATWNGDTWEIDDSSPALSELRRAAEEAGYVVEEIER